MSRQEPPETHPNILVETSRLLVRRPEGEDLPCLERLFCDPTVMRYLGDVWTPEQVIETLNEWREDWGMNNLWCGVLLKKDTSEPVGTAGFSENTIPGESGLELSWFVLPEHQGQGFATEITVELLRFAFDDLGAERVLADTHPDNPASNRVLKKLGFKCLGERHHQYDFLPGFDTQVLWELRRESWQQETS